VDYLQIALDGVRLFNADGKTMLRIYPLESITRWAVQQPTVFTFWAKTSVDVEQRAVKLSSNEGTTTAILDMLTAACVQVSSQCLPKLFPMYLLWDPFEVVVS
jgi:hypothetical protein